MISRLELSLAIGYQLIAGVSALGGSVAGVSALCGSVDLGAGGSGRSRKSVAPSVRPLV